MEIKAFKEGIAQLAAYTNQRQADPNPFALQFAKDSRVSLMAADESATLVWDIGFSDHVPDRVGVSSKMLYQASKVLKGKGNVSFEFGDNDLIVTVQGGGKVTLPYEELPAIHHRPDKRYDAWLDSFNLADYVKKLKAVQPTLHNYVVATPLSPEQTTTVRINASNGYIVWETMERPLSEIAEPLAWSIDSMTTLKYPSKNSTLSLGEKSIKVESQDFTLYTRLLRADEFIHYPSLRGHHYPAEKRPPVAVEVNKTNLTAAIKAVAPDTKDQQFMLSLDEGGKYLKVSGVQMHNSVDVPISKSVGHGYVSLGAIHTLPVLAAFESSSILVVFGNPKTPVGFREKNNLYESYLVATVFKS